MALGAGAKRMRTEEGDAVHASEWFEGEEMKEEMVRVPAVDETETGADEELVAVQEIAASEETPAVAETPAVTDLAAFQETKVRYFTMREFPPLAHPSEEDTIVIERDCYVTIFDQLVECIRNPYGQVRRRKNFHIDGSPGIGKSRFYLYCAFRLALDAAVRAALPEFKLVLNCKNKYGVYDPQTRAFESIRGEAEIDGLQRNRQVVRLIEADSDRLSGWMGTSIFFSSPGHVGLNDFLKDRGYTYVMPTWSLMELRVYNSLPRQGQLDDKTLVDMYNKRGGIPRSIFWTEQDTFRRKLHEVLQGAAALKLIDIVTSMTCLKEIKYSHRILEMVPTAPNFGEAYHLAFVSNHVAGLVADQLSRDSRERLSAFFMDEAFSGASGTAALIGSIYERLCHSKIITRQPLLQFRPLAGSKGAAYTIQIPSDMQVVEFQTLAEIVTIPAGTTYFKPKAKNFGAVDAFILVSGAQPRCYGLQMTINKAHGIKVVALKTFQAFLARLKITDFRFGFVVPKGLAGGYPRQALVTKKDSAHARPPKAQSIDQFVAGFDVVDRLDRPSSASTSRT